LLALSGCVSYSLGLIEPLEAQKKPDPSSASIVTTSVFNVIITSNLQHGVAQPSLGISYKGVSCGVKIFVTILTTLGYCRSNSSRGHD
jgi:hypothetical protein